MIIRHANMEQVQEDHSASTPSRNSLLYNLTFSLALKVRSKWCLLCTLNQSFCLCFKYQREGNIQHAQRASDKTLGFCKLTQNKPQEVNQC